MQSFLSKMFQWPLLTDQEAQFSGAIEFNNCITSEGKDYTNECCGNNIKPSDGEAPTLEIWGIRSTPSLPLLPGSLWPGVIEPDWVLSMGQIEQTVYKQMTDVKLWLFI